VNLGLLVGVIRRRAQLRAHDRWSRAQLERYQRTALAELRRFAAERSPLYRELHRGLADARLNELPVLSKQLVMERFDELVTDRSVTLAEVESFLRHAGPSDTFRGRYRIAATGGTTGRRGVFLSDAAEWKTVLASYSRAYDWAGIRAGITHRTRMAVVSSRNPSHQSALVGATVASRFVPTLRLDAMQPIEEVTSALNAFQPEALVGYASMLRILAEQQSAGSLSIRPAAVFSASEVLTDETRTRIHAAFGIRPTNVYAATETAGIASECRLGHLHRYEDLVITEIVDTENRPVPAGEFGAKLLVTVLFSRTQPLIRYEMSDRVAAASATCGDGLPYALLDGIEGREEEVLTLHGVTIHPNVFHAVLESLPVAGWQVVESNGSLRVLLAGADRVDTALAERQIIDALAERGAHRVDVRIELVDTIPGRPSGRRH
jgi:phenylacetate-CoA ligase